MVNSPGSKVRRTVLAHHAKNDPRPVFPNLHRHTLTSWQDGGKAPETITTITDEARIQNNRVEAVEAGEKNAHRLSNKILTTRPVPTSTRYVHGRDVVAPSSKRKLHETSPEPLPIAKRIHSTGKEGQGRRSHIEKVDEYKYLTRRQLRAECWARSILASGSSQDLIKRLRLEDAAQACISSGQESGAEPSDRYTHMLQKDLRKECVKRSLPVGLTKTDLRRCLRLYDAARALGLTPEESLEAQRATFEHPEGDCARVERQKFGASPEEDGEGQPLGKASQETVEDKRQGPSSLHNSENNVFRNTKSQTSSEKVVGPSSATAQASSEDSTQDWGTSDMCLGPAATPNYATIGQAELRSLCKLRSLKQHGLSSRGLRVALTKYDKELAEQANNADFKADAEHRTVELGVAESVSPPPIAYIDLDSSSQDDEMTEQRTPSVDAGAPITKEPVSNYLWTVNTGQRPPVSTDAQTYVSPYSPQLVHNASKTYCNGSSPRRTPYTKHPMSQQQPLVSLINLAIKDTKSGASECAHQETQMRTKPLSELAIKMAEKENFNARYATESPTFICCCDTPGYKVRKKGLSEFAANCLYHVSQLAQQGVFTIKEYQEYLVTQQALGRIKSCLCQKPSVDHPEHQVTMTQGGFILAQIWREQLTRRQSLTTFRPDMAAYRRKGILEVMHNVHEDFMIELSSRQRKRPLVLWARIEAMAWFINTLPTSSEWHHFRNWKRPCRYIMLFGIALLTTIDALLQQNLFKDKQPKIPNLGLVLALFVQSTWDSRCTMNSSHSKDAYKSPFNNDVCLKNENGWAAEVVSLADQHGVRIGGVKSIDFIVDRWRLRKKSFEAIRDRARKEQYAVSNNGETIPSSVATLASLAAKEGETPAKRKTGQQVTVRAFWTPIRVMGKVLGYRQSHCTLFCSLDLQCDLALSCGNSFVPLFESFRPFFASRFVSQPKRFVFEQVPCLAVLPRHVLRRE